MFKEGEKFQHVFVLSENIQNQFILMFNDKNPLHTNSEFAKDKGFQDKVMHGNILNGFLSYFIGECLPTKNVIIHTQNIEYKKPVYMGESLQFFAEVNGVFESVSAVEFKYNFKNSFNKIVAKGKFQIGILQ